MTLERLPCDDTLDANWLAALDRIFPTGVPVTAVWSDLPAIVGTMTMLAAPNTGHLFYPDHGGDDLVSVRASGDQDDWIELYADEHQNWPRIVRPQHLHFVCPSGCLQMAYFLLETRAISTAPEFPESAGQLSEEYAQGRNGKKYTHAQWQNDDDGSEGHLPDDVRRIARYWKGGLFAVFSKASGYNRISIPNFDAYDATHMRPEEFNKAVAALTEHTLKSLHR